MYMYECVLARKWIHLSFEFFTPLEERAPRLECVFLRSLFVEIWDPNKADIPRNPS